MKISELVKKLLEEQNIHGDLVVFTDDDCEVASTTFYPADEENESFLVLETE